MSFSKEILPNVPKSEIYEPEIEWNNILVTKEKCSFIFTIENYSLLQKKNEEFIKSSKFSMKNNEDIKWYLKLYPNGENKDSEGYMSLFLYLSREKENLPDIVATYKISIVDKNVENNKNVEAGNTRIFGSSWGYAKFIKNEELFNRKEAFLPNDTLTIFCSVIAGIDTQIEKKMIAVNKVLEDYSQNNEIFKLDTKFETDFYVKFYEDDSLTDIILTCDNKELKAHKAFLAAVSPVFASIFKKDIKKKEIDSIIVTDISYEAMRELLHFLYTKKIDNLHNIAHELIVAANKYGIQDLMFRCEQSLCKSIDLDNILKIIVIADENDASMLKKTAIEFIIKNKQALKNNPDFKETFNVRPHLYELIFWAD